MEKRKFWDVLKSIDRSINFYLKHDQSIFSSYYPQTERMKKKFSTCWFYSLQRVVIYLEHPRTIFIFVFCAKRKNKNISNSRPKSWTGPLEKCKLYNFLQSTPPSYFSSPFEQKERMKKFQLTPHVTKLFFLFFRTKRKNKELSNFH